MPDDDILTMMKKYKKEELATMLLAAQSQLATYHKDVLFHTDGTLDGTTFLIDGVQPANITTIRLRAYRKTGIEVSYENIKTEKNGYKRHWIYGEKSELSRLYYKEKREKEQNK